MILTIPFFLFLSIVICIYTLKPQDKKKKSFKFLIPIYIISLFFFTTSLYLISSNYWVGKNLFEKFTNNTTIKQAKNLNIEDLNIILRSLELELLKSPDDINLLKKVAKFRYILLDFRGALKAFQKGYQLNPTDQDFIIGLANTRYILEKENTSKKTINLFKEILKVDPKNVTALIVLGEHSYKNNNYVVAKSHYKKLLSLIDKNSLEYKEIFNRYKTLEESDDN